MGGKTNAQMDRKSTSKYQMLMAPQNSYSEILIPRAVIFGGGTFCVSGDDQSHEKSGFLNQMPQRTPQPFCCVLTY